MDREIYARLDSDQLRGPCIRDQDRTMRQTLDAVKDLKSNTGHRLSILDKWLHGLFSFLPYTKFTFVLNYIVQMTGCVHDKRRH